VWKGEPMQRRFRGLVVIVVLAGFGPAGCGKKTEEPATSTSAEPGAPSTAAATARGPSPVGPDACAILTVQEIEEAVGLKVTASEHVAGGALNTCEHQLGGSPLVRVLITIHISSAKETFDNAPGEPLAGVGDQAKWLAAAGMLAVLRGETSFTVAVMRLDDTPPEKKLEQAKRLAARLLDRL